ncbi:hypothetical protein BRAS3809_7930002 [Bradyrhizobium sp. STM 3809]|nr:hypothetical protein BRAS3809_7930002 [Bradyrhizobium sp. STM 3809]
MIGGAFGHQGLGNQIGGIAGQLAQRFLPFEAAPQFVPQGAIGNFLGQVGAPLGGVIGNYFGNQGLGQNVGGLAGQLAQRFLPFEAAPDLAPQGFFGNLLGQVGAPLGSAIGGYFGNRNLGNQIGGIAGQLGQRFLPFEAAPDLAPQGFFGNLLGQVGAPLGSAIGGYFGNRNLGNQIGGIAGQLGQRFLPFDAGPDLAPQGFFGNLLGNAPRSMMTNCFGNRGFGPNLGDVLGQAPLAQQAIQRLLPFDAAPELVPQGLLGGFLGSTLGGLGGGFIGKALGNRNLGHTIGSTAGGVLGSILPFDASQQLAQNAWAQNGWGNVPVASVYPYQGVTYH